MKLSEAIANYNKDKNFILLKLVEELNELSTALLQFNNKPDELNQGMIYNILDEVADVELRLQIFKETQLSENHEYIDKRIKSKKDKYKLRIKEGKKANI